MRIVLTVKSTRASGGPRAWTVGRSLRQAAPCEGPPSAEKVVWLDAALWTSCGEFGRGWVALGYSDWTLVLTAHNPRFDLRTL